MRTSAVIMPFFALFSGAAGFYLRLLELWNVFDKRTGLPARGATVTYALIALSAVFLIVAMAFALRAGMDYKSPQGFENAFGAESLGYPFVFFVLGLIWLGATVKYFIDMNADGVSPNSELIFAILSALSAISLSLFAIEIYQNPRRKSKLALSIVPTVFMCYWLIFLYRDNAANPILLRYCYQCLALIASTLGFYYTSAYAYEKQAPGRAIFLYFAAIFFCFVSLADDQESSIKLIYIVLIAVNAVNSSLLIRNMEKKAH